MILYVDTSALVKLYVTEAGNADVARWVAGADQIWTSVVAFAETRSAFRRKLGERALTPDEHAEVLAQLDQDWRHLERLEVTHAIGGAAGVLVTRHGLRGFDAVHLATALHVQALLPAGELVQFASYDPKLVNAALAENLASPQ